MATQLAHLYGKEIPAKWGNFPASAWRRLVAEYLQEPLPDGRHLLLIVDGLDEAVWQPDVDIVAELHRLSEGAPLLVELYVKDLWRRGEAVTRLQPEDLRGIQPGYKD